MNRILKDTMFSKEYSCSEIQIFKLREHVTSKFLGCNLPKFPNVMKCRIHEKYL